jgi:CheY-like chemotaxis protein
MKRDDIGSNKQVELKVKIDEKIGRLHIVSDNLRLTQVLSNLINNAIKFTCEGFIEVGCSRIPNTEILEFYVKDTGIGIQEENQDLVFERFRKLEENKKQLHRGTGLGLAISFQLVNLMGGNMWLKSQFGAGSTFFFTIPLIPVEPGNTHSPKKEEPDITPDYRNCTILVAEDDMANFNFIDKLLKKANAHVLHAEDGAQVLQMLLISPDVKVILMDIKMPVMDGIETLHELRRRNIRIPVIAQTAYALAEEVVKLKKEGFDDYISKPIQRPILYGILNQYI